MASLILFSNTDLSLNFSQSHEIQLRCESCKQAERFP